VWDLGISSFYGISREARFVPSDDGTSLTPHYDKIQQIGMDIQATMGATLWKLEALDRSGRQPTDGRFQAVVAGVEHTLYSIAGTTADLGVIAEYLYDNRPDTAPRIYADRDVFMGFRCTANDVRGTTLLFGAIAGSGGDATLVTLEASRRLGDTWVIELEAMAVTHASDDALLSSMDRDGHFAIHLIRYF
jgi:hypothetical protein